MIRIYCVPCHWCSANLILGRCGDVWKGLYYVEVWVAGVAEGIHKLYRRHISKYSSLSRRPSRSWPGNLPTPGSHARHETGSKLESRKTLSITARSRETMPIFKSHCISYAWDRASVAYKHYDLYLYLPKLYFGRILLLVRRGIKRLFTDDV